MNPQITNLYKITQKKHKLILGLMSGTSLDGLDIALCKFSGFGLNTKFELLHFTTFPYSINFKKQIEQIFCKENVSLQQVCLMNNYVAQVHATIINKTLQQWKIDKKNIDIIASHGQTIYHAPKHLHKQKTFDNATLQIGDGDIIAHKTGIITISDFRQKNIAAGGSGAPLALYGDYFLCSSKKENRVLLNIGGIANFTYLPKSQNFDDVICTDIGTGNTLMDMYTKKYFNNPFDKDGKIATKGKVNEKLLKQLLSNPFFKNSFPKSTGQETFNEAFVEECLAKSKIKLSNEDVLATLNFFTAKSIQIALLKTIKHNNYSLYISGGGGFNKTLLQNLSSLLPNISIKNTDDLKINVKAKEAILFALLANETLCSNNNFYNKKNKIYPTIRMGKVSFPS